MEMPNITIRPGWHIPGSRVTPENVYHRRRGFLRQMGFAGIGAVLAGFAGNALGTFGAETNAEPAPPKGFPYPRNNQFDLPKMRLTDEEVATSYNNFYEFSTTKTRVKRLTGRFTTSPWEVEIGGLVEKPGKLDVEDIARQFTLEERVYRFRCVEAWSMVVPWTGFPLSKLIERVAPKPQAKFVKFTTFLRPDQAPGFSELSTYPWPYTEGLRMDEAMHPLTLVATGMYGKPLPKQNGAPIRMIVPWKYGYKSIKSIVRIEFVPEQPKTLWETLGPDEYPFESNVNPRVPHPRWSQATERVVDSGARVNTLPYNGYGDYVARLYPSA